MISKLVPPLNGLTGLVTSCTTNGVTGTLLLVLISMDTKLKGLQWNQGKQYGRLVIQVDNSSSKWANSILSWIYSSINS